MVTQRIQHFHLNSVKPSPNVSLNVLLPNRTWLVSPLEPLVETAPLHLHQHLLLFSAELQIKSEWAPSLKRMQTSVVHMLVFQSVKMDRLKWRWKIYPFSVPFQDQQYFIHLMQSVRSAHVN